MLRTERLQSQCEALLGAESVQTDPRDTTAYALGPSTPAAVVQPETVEQVAAVLALAGREHLGVVPWGQGTQMHLGGLPRRYDLALSLTRLRRVVEYDNANLTLRAEAGLPLHQVYALTAPQRQFLPLGYAHSPQSLGGVLITNSSGVKRLRYGAIRDLLLGVQVALPDGTLVRFGGRVVKNVAGYDMNKLFLGSLGAFGVVVETTYRLTALPPEDHLCAVVFATPAQALQAVAAVRAAALWPSALLVLPAITAQELPGVVPGTVRSPQTVLYLNYDGTSEAVEQQIQQSRVCCQPYSPVAEAVVTGAALLTWWEQVETWRTASPSAPTTLLSLRCGVPPAHLGAALALLDTVPTACAQSYTWMVDAGSGQLWAHLTLPEANTKTLAAALQAWIQTWRAQLQRYQGYAVVESAPASLRPQLELWGHPTGWQLLPRYKQRFDPQGVLNPGRYIAGL